jgi:LAO/AO transport system kinase
MIVWTKVVFIKIEPVQRFIFLSGHPEPVEGHLSIFVLMEKISLLIDQLQQGDAKALARCITIVENELEGYEEILISLKPKATPVIGITGPPGAGKSSLINALLNVLSKQNKKTGIIAIDPTSPFNFGSLLGDRIRMSGHFTNDNIFIRSLATRGSLGGLSAKAIEITDVMRAFGFDQIIVETVGVGQSEVEIAGLADTTVLVLVPEGGDEVQAIKSGIMEIADIFVVNKGDRDGAETFIKNIRQLLHLRKASDWEIPVIKTVASKEEGVKELLEKIQLHSKINDPDRKNHLLAEKAYRLISNYRMKDVKKSDLLKEIESASEKKDFNLYEFVRGKKVSG